MLWCKLYLDYEKPAIRRWFITRSTSAGGSVTYQIRLMSGLSSASASNPAAGSILPLPRARLAVVPIPFMTSLVLVACLPVPPGLVDPAAPLPPFGPLPPATPLALAAPLARLGLCAPGAAALVTVSPWQSKMFMPQFTQQPSLKGRLAIVGYSPEKVLVITDDPGCMVGSVYIVHDALEGA